MFPNVTVNVAKFLVYLNSGCIRCIDLATCMDCRDKQFGRCGPRNLQPGSCQLQNRIQQSKGHTIFIFHVVFPASLGITGAFQSLHGRGRAFHIGIVDHDGSKDLPRMSVMSVMPIFCKSFHTIRYVKSWNSAKPSFLPVQVLKENANLRGFNQQNATRCEES